jgi:predicted ATPase/DNA-binding CsgD family transcriptional regulator
MIREPRSEFVGRRAELDSIAVLVDAQRLVTLTGVGGVGKTRLAIRSSNNYAKRHDVRSWFVPLDTVAEPALLPLAVVSALGLTDQSARAPLEVIVDALSECDALVVLDNCEHVIAAASTFADQLLDALPRLRLLATSRRPLDLAGEHIFAVPPLSLTEDDGRSSDALLLLDSRARAAGAPGLTSREDELAAIELCRSLDGLPLAIELAATRLRTLTITEMMGRLSSRFSLLENGPRNSTLRQRTLRAVVDWSYELCDPGQRDLWERLSVFSGGFALSAAIAVADIPAEMTVNILDQLVAQSVIEADHESGRFRMLETIRGYGRERAEASGNWSPAVRRHLDHIRHTAATIRGTWWGPGQADKLARLRADRAEVQSALVTAAMLEPDIALELFSDLRYHWAVGGFLREGRAWATRVLAAGSTNTARRLPALVTAAWLCLLQGDRAEAGELMSSAESLAATVSVTAVSPETKIATLIELPRWRGTEAMFSGDPERAEKFFSRSIRAALAGGRPEEAMLSQFQLTTARTHLHRPDAAAPAADALQLAESIGETWMRSHALWSLALAAFVVSDLAGAESNVRDALQVEQGFDDPVGLCLMLEMLCWINVRRGANDRAAMLLGAVATQWRRIGSDISVHGPQLAAHHDQCVATARERLGPRLFAKILDEGSRLTPQDAVDLAIAFSPPSSGSLSAREKEVASGIHRGLSNREIGDELVLSVRTIDTHVQRIFAKLGVASRSQVAAWYESLSN